MSAYRAWAYSPPKPQAATRPAWRNAGLPERNPVLPFGNGRSYGDSCLNSTGTVIDSRSLDHVLEFDRKTGRIRGESGLLLASLHNITLAAGWFVPVTPGTSYVTLGGALANDVHGKNHHRDGCFGNHVLAFELCRSDGSRVICSPTSNEHLFAATIGGLGLTGFVTWVEFQLLPVESSLMDVNTRVFYGLDEFMALSAESHDSHQYSVAWLDCVASGKNFGRGIFIQANHSQQSAAGLSASGSGGGLPVPMDFPGWALNRVSVRAFNELYFHKHRLMSLGDSTQPFQRYFYPLDSLQHWNRIYGSGGFYQYQFVVPLTNTEALTEVLKRIVRSGQGSFLAVLKLFGSCQSPGLMSFPEEGPCLALDFPNKGKKTLDLLDDLDSVVTEANGCVYPAKDNRMSAAAFQQYFPQMNEFAQHIDPGFSSDFWRRVSD
ncbi:MAG: FAD-binding oxidoreductase [Pseudomonadota bacterium]